MIAQNLLDDFAAAIIADYKAWGGKNETTRVEFETGKKYIRVVRADQSSRSAHSFIEIETGNILKSDGWKRPANGSRGHITNLTPRVTAWTSAT